MLLLCLTGVLQTMRRLPRAYSDTKYGTRVAVIIVICPPHTFHITDVALIEVDHRAVVGETGGPRWILQGLSFWPVCSTQIIKFWRRFNGAGESSDFRPALASQKTMAIWGHSTAPVSEPPVSRVFLVLQQIQRCTSQHPPACLSNACH